MKQPRKNKPATITLPPGVLEESRRRTAELGLSFSAYVAMLIAVDAGARPVTAASAD